ncbi:hypothetical protein A3D01_00705 [Candidatus Woesebacteria bacterium RIFCSPHIGHO2_02_FULL_39_13]|uniref:Uncharacterized protein n=1 Tax=Candidatus Woesebacteria bacterium RIFCSPHIGHO2_02_FULL_39_13 TaxID=1802505 RepID=A0A1F7YX60_9BACT|nr:MAG: hypothetical protein A2692_05850 [Candidatus Woesebacteria bacterium RIFCSPHIGHO2_01_FULL_39_95]OGM31936.1 MAG: hypothetical protein A3D01_00705 [Candidatus Woesebacteria bacterium RIFCSPHIGHO2_02_FULL_39_13]OGM36500.1 MAG: hypothetical protein A3E13_02480 [Candidatus Woesebacteria bacterium RIFCSPHIGHO2_12_FULL_40_20]
MHLYNFYCDKITTPNTRARTTKLPEKLSKSALSTKINQIFKLIFWTIFGKRSFLRTKFLN